MIWAARIIVVAAKTVVEARRRNITQKDVQRITWWLMFGEDMDEEMQRAL